MAKRSEFIAQGYVMQPPERLRVSLILSNEKYKGDALLQKTFTVDFLMHKNASYLNAENCLTSSDIITVHPGAEMYYKEIGLLN